MAIKGSVTLADVAAASGVSTATVSRVLNRHPQIDNATRKKVYRIIEELGYENASVNRRVSALSQAKVKTYSLELLLCPLSEQKNMLTLDFFREILNGIQSFFSQTVNVNMNLSTWASEDECNLKQNEMVFRRLLQADGVMIVGNPSRELIAQLLQHQINPVLISHDFEDLPINSVESDNFSGGIIAARYLLDRGFKRIGFFTGPENINSWTMRRRGAMLETVSRVGAENFICHYAPSSDIKTIFPSFRQWLQSGNCPNALITSHCSAASAVGIVLRENGLRCPDDFSIITFDDASDGMFDLQMTYLQTYPRQMGIKAAQRVMQILTHPHSEDQPHKITIPMKLIEGASVKNISQLPSV